MRKGYIILSFIVMLGMVSGCTNSKDDGKIKVVSTIGMIHDIVRNVGDDLVVAKGLMGPGVDPHLYKPSAGDVSTLAKADIIFYNGLHLEAKMGEVLEKMGDKRVVVAVTNTIPKDKLLAPAEFEGMPDPHVWFDVSLWMNAVESVRAALVLRDSTNTETYNKNAKEYVEKLKQLDTKVKQKIAMLPPEERILVTAHDAFNYFGKAYGFTVKGLQGISTAAEAGTRDVQDLATFIAEKKIPAIFVESAVPERHIRAVQDAVVAKGWQVKIGGELFADAMGDSDTKEGTYIGMIDHNVETIVNALVK